MLPNREGRFKATIGEHGVAETGPNSLATFVCEFHLMQELTEQEWIPVDEDLSITGYFYLEKRDGSLNTVAIDQLKEALGWDGRDPFWLQDTDFSNHIVQVKLAFEEYDGKTRIKVQYVNPEDWSGGGVPVADDSMRRSIAGRLGAKFRANAGGSPAPGPRPAAGSRPAPTSSGATATAAPPPELSTATMEQAWETFANACPEKWSRQHLEDEWFRLIGEMYPGKQPEQLSGADWAKVLADAPGAVIPF